MRRRTIVVAAVGVALALLVYAGLMVRRGFSARDTPSQLETVIASLMRALAMPASAKSQPNPFQPTAEVLADARAHFADHCALCHANNGSGETTMGQRLYPKAPDMRLPATQNRSDGELHDIIQNGIRLSGMPAWGEKDEGDDSWKLAIFIHHLLKFTPEELREMKRLNPKSAAELEQEKAEEEFLRGGPAPDLRPSPPRH